MSHRGHMHANLVRASRFDLDFYQRKLAVGRIDFSLYHIMGHRLAPPEAPRPHACAPLRVAADHALNRAASLFLPRLDPGVIGLAHLPPAELTRQPTVSLVAPLPLHRHAASPFHG